MKRIPIHTIRILLLPIFAFLPAQAGAQVVINEVMYNPQGSDSGREWVELYNEGRSDVAMVAGSGKDSWRLSDSSNHTLIDPTRGTGRGSLTIPADGYLIVANDPNDFISGEYAGGHYSVVKASLSLSNNGATVSLIDGSGTTVDTMTYSPTQGGSDDGSSLQRQADGSWIAATPTQGAANSNVPYIVPAASNAQGSTQSAASSTDQNTGQSETPFDSASYVAPPAPSIYANAGADRMVIVGADVEFDANAYDKTQKLLDLSTVRFMWNFGDGATAEGQSVLHHFSYPGRYAVVLEIAQNKNAAISELAVNAQPAQLSFSLQQDGGIAIQNLSGRDLDLSNWIVREDPGQFAEQFMLPKDSKVFAGSSLQISPQTLSFRASSSTMLEYPNGVRSLSIGESSATPTAAEAPQESPVQAFLPTAPKSTVPVKQTTNAKPTPSSSGVPNGDAAESLDDASDSIATTSDPVDESLVATSATLEIAAAASSPIAKYLWWLGIGALAFAAAASFATAKHFKSGEWGIIEDGSE